MGPSDADIRKQDERLDKNDLSVRAPRGTQLNCHGWPQEAALRMLMNSVDPRVAERPRRRLASGATGKLLRNGETYAATVKALKALQANETLLIRSGKPAGVVKSNQSAPRVVIADSKPAAVLPCSVSPEPRIPVLPFEASAASWTFLGTQEALPIAFQTLDAAGQKHFGGDLAGRLVVSGGMGTAGGALPLAAGLLSGAFLGIDVNGEHIQRRIREGYCDYCVNALDEALRILKIAVRQKQAVAVGLVGNCAEVIPELAVRGVLPDILTDQTGANNLLRGYIPSGLTVEEANKLRHNDPQGYLARAHDSVSRHFRGMLALQKLGSIVFEFGNGIQAAAGKGESVQCPSAFPDFAETYLRPLLDQGLAPVRWVALSGEAGDIKLLDSLMLERVGDDGLPARRIPLAQEYLRFQGLPARVCWLDQDARIRLADRANGLVAEGAIQAPLVVAWDFARGKEEAARHSEPEQEAADDPPPTMPATDALLKAAAGAAWVSLESGANYSQTSVVAVADGSVSSAKSLAQALRNDFAAGILRAGSAGRKKS